MKRFAEWPIKHKLRGLLLLMASVAALSICVPMGLVDFLWLRHATSRDLNTLSDVVARNSTAALGFNDADTATDVLQALRAEPGIVAACLYSSHGRPVATYVSPARKTTFLPPALQPEGIYFARGRVFAFRKVVLGGEQVGSVYLESDLHRFEDQLRQYRTSASLAFLITALVATFLVPLVERPITQPLAHLVTVTNRISQQGDYSIRADLPRRDEFGLVGSAFNGMLKQIERRDHELAISRETLENQVAVRTAELVALNTRLSLLAAALQAAANSILITDVRGTVVWTNPAFAAASGYSEEEIIGRHISLFHGGSQGAAFWNDLWLTVLAGKTWKGEVVGRKKNGGLFTEETTITPVSLGDDGAISHFVAIKQDITQRKESEEALRLAEEKYRGIFEDAIVGIFQISPVGRPLSVNRALAQMHGFDSAENFLSSISDIGTQIFVNPEEFAKLTATVAERGYVRSAELQVRRRDGSVSWVLANMRAVREATGSIVCYEGTVEDITDRKLAEQRVRFLAYYDSLTGLPNRTLLHDRLSTALAAARREKKHVALLFLDLDRFKIINDSMGHSVGDLLLQEVGNRLKALVRQEDTVARVGGDEFLIALSASTAADAASAAQRILESMKQEFAIQGHSYSMSCSIGISLFPENGSDAESLIKNADAAMYCSKESGRNTVRFFNEQMSAAVVERLQLERRLRGAMDSGDLFLVYQPQVETRTGRIAGFEALIRWKDRELGVVPAEKLVHVAENSGLIFPLGEWVLRTACKQGKRWIDQFGPLTVGVNVSAPQFRQEGFPDLVRGVLLETGLPAHFLELELTESVLFSNADAVFEVLNGLKAMGVKLAIDDFGTGYSSLSYLRQFPITRLKIDRSFVQDVETKGDGALITVAVINMAKSLNLRVIAEGVETQAQLSFLRRHNCDAIQGYCFSRPLGIQQAEELLLQQLQTSYAPSVITSAATEHPSIYSAAY